jgi:hypothetical protein
MCVGKIQMLDGLVYTHCNRAFIVKLFTTVINSITLKASVNVIVSHLLQASTKTLAYYAA